MKTLLLPLLLGMSLVSCSSQTSKHPLQCYPSSDSIQVLLDSIHTLNLMYDAQSELVYAQDTTIHNLQTKPVMSPEQFIQLYKYQRLEKYYRICKKNPTQWKFYKGWSTRVFEQGE